MVLDIFSQKDLTNDLSVPARRKGGFVKGWVLANVPSFPAFLFSFRGTSECTLVPDFVPGNIRMHPRSGFRSGVTSAKTTLLENHPVVNPRLVSHCSAIGDAISRDGPYNAIGFRGKFFCDTPLVSSVFGLR